MAGNQKQSAVTNPGIRRIVNPVYTVKVARAFRVTLDALVADSKLPDVLGDQAMLERWQGLDALPSGERQRILDVLDSLIRDAQARIAYAKPG